MERIFIELGFAIAGATLFGIVAHFLRQPLILAYIVTGFILGPALLNILGDAEVVELFSTIGIAFLLFIVGMELNIDKIKEVGTKALGIGLIQITVTAVLAYALSLFLGLSVIASMYIGVAFAFSSTVVVIKLLSEKKALISLYGKIVIGVLILQDIAALFVLIILSGMQDSASLSVPAILDVVARGVAVSVVVYFISRILLHRLFKYLAHSTELLFISSIAWCFAVSGVFILLGFSIEMGAFMAGITIAGLPYSEEISVKLAPLRDFFLVLFFVALGMQIDFSNISSVWPTLALLVAFVIVIKPLIIMIVMGSMGFAKRTSFYTSVSLSQVSEFSLIIAGMGFALGHIDRSIVSLIIIVTLVTILASSYGITFLGNIYALIQKVLSVFERKSIRERKVVAEMKGHIIVFGYHRFGPHVFAALKKISQKIIVADIDPEVIDALRSQGVLCVYGDAYDTELLERLNVGGARIIVTTFPAKKRNHFLITKIRSINKRVKILTVADELDEALYLYEAGADYVILPHYLSADYVSAMLNKINQKKLDFHTVKADHIRLLKGLTQK